MKLQYKLFFCLSNKKKRNSFLKEFQIKLLCAF